jgi:hypothetical protein
MPPRTERSRRYGEDLTEEIDGAAVGSAKTSWRRFSKRGRTMSSWVDASSACDANGGNVEVNGGLSGRTEELDRGPAMAAATEVGGAGAREKVRGGAEEKQRACASSVQFYRERNDERGRDRGSIHCHQWRYWPTITGKRPV